MAGYGSAMSQRIIERAWRAYLTAAGLDAERPTSRSTVETVEGLTYVVLRSDRIVLAAYRLTNRSKLRRLKRWPLALNSMGGIAARERADCTQPNSTKLRKVTCSSLVALIKK